MTPNSPTPRRRQAGRLLSAGGAAAAAAALALSGVIPAAAAPSASAPPMASGEKGVPEASARIAFVDWCSRGAVGQTGAEDGAGHDDSAGWRDAPGEVAGDRHFPAEPEDAYSSVVYDSGRLTAAAGVTGIRFTPDCRIDDSALSTPTSVTDAFGREALLVLDSAASTAWWSAASGPSAQITVRGLEILGRSADVSDGDYTGTFTADSGDGKITVAVEAERHVSKPGKSGQPPSGGPSGDQRAEAFLSVRFEVDRVDAEGKPVSEFDYGVEFAGTAVHIPAGGVPGTQAPGPETETASPEPEATFVAPEPPGPLNESADAPEDTRPTTRSSGEEDPETTLRPDDPQGAATTDPTASPSGDAATEPTQQESASGPTVAAPTDPEHAPSVGPGGADPGGEPTGGRLPVAGSALIGLVATGLAALGGGGTAIYLGRGRKSGFDGDDVVDS